MKARGELTGKHALILFVGFFGVIFAVNGFMAWSAISTFPGLEANNGYIASQTFNARKAAQLALGWHLRADVEKGVLHIAFTDAAGHPVRPARLEASIGRATESRDDLIPGLKYVDGRFEAPVSLGEGKWILRLKAHAEDGTLFQQRRPLIVERG